LYIVWKQEAPGLIHFAFDAWTSATMQGYLGITCHFLDSGWNIQSELMSFRDLDGPHTSENIAKVLLAEITKMIPAEKVSASRGFMLIKSNYSVDWVYCLRQCINK
jgi:hypothetical protein